VFEHLNTPEEIFSFKLGSALTMEQTILEMLGELAAATNRTEIRTMLEAHATETQQHIANIEQSFALLGEEVHTKPCPTIDGLHKEGKSMLSKTDDTLVDAVILAGANETEHHEIAVYETLIVNAKARGAHDVAALLQQNLDSETATLEKVHATAERVSTQGIAVPA
jgi:ferritin-like metal-binding protein YciE